ncbi:MAG: maleylpyruvate isomerase family mycothiol-dependent enzyme [Ilumatobacter sp.]|uniref:maleylpyruvate isomerase family mycothiol-dependent enzyme n=1 Tax=Ilumatobacter sp. TaxID=1967498 RepID=UPI00391B3C05
MDLPYHPLDVLQNNGIATIDMLRDADLDLRVAACPDWTLGDLAHHLGATWHFWGRLLDEGITDRADLQRLEAPSRPTGDLLIDWLGITHNELFSALTAAPLDTAVWTWTGAPRDAAWVRRRMAIETSIHRWDVANAIGVSYAVPTAIAADGIDEFLTWFAARERREGEMKVGGTVHLHCTDTDTDTDTGTGTGTGDVAGGEWFISSMKEPAATFTREHRKGDAAVRGSAHDLLLWLWRRDDRLSDGVEIIGKDVVARRFRAFTDLD